MTRADFEKKKSKIPDAPGVYFFLGPRKEILYIGKATYLRDRVRSYFSSDLMDARGPLVVQMVEKARSIDWRRTDSVLEALILEANLIRTHKPKHNTLAKDDKSFKYVAITREDFPRVLPVRGKDLPDVQFKIKALFGPFPHGAQLNQALKIIRKIFPYRDKCTPCKTSEKSTYPQTGRTVLPVGGGGCKPCFNRQLGLCPGVCSGEIGKREYGKAIRHIILFFEGKKKALLRELTREMKTAAKDERFEEAAEFRRQLFALQHIQDVSLIKDEFRSSPMAASGAAPFRIEAYDVAHLHGSAAVGVMVVVENGTAQKNEYRTFHIREAKAGDDAGALHEVLSRRLGHPEWSLPRLIVVDGAKAQMHTAEKIVQDFGMGIPVVGVVKDEHHRARSILGDGAIRLKHEKDILLANFEAHRFSIARHKIARSKNFLQKTG